MSKTITLFILLVILIGCSNGSKKISTISNVNKICINPTQCDTILFSNVVEDIKEIKLKTDSEDFIGEINQLIVSPDRIIVRDQITKTIWIFHKNGILDYKLNKCGNGPGEYFSVDYINLLEEKQVLQVFDNHKNKVFFYDFRNGNYLFSKNNSFSFHSLVNDGNDYLVYANKRLNFDFSINKYKSDTLCFNYYLLDSNFRCKKKWHPFQLKNHPMGWSYQFGIHVSRRNKDFLFMESFNDTVYHINSKTLNPEYVIDFGDFKEKNDFYHQDRSTFPQKFKNIKGACFTCNFHEYENLIYMTYYYKKMFKNCLYYKKENKYYTGLLYNDISGFWGKLACMSNGIFYYCVDKDMIDLYVNDLNKQNNKFSVNYYRVNKKLQDRIGKNRNPIIFEVKFKKSCK